MGRNCTTCKHDALRRGFCNCCQEKWNWQHWEAKTQTRCGPTGGTSVERQRRVNMATTDTLIGLMFLGMFVAILPMVFFR